MPTPPLPPTVRPSPPIVEPIDPPGPRVSWPSLAAEIDLSPGNCPTGSAVFDIAQAIRDALAPISSAVDVRVRCTGKVFTVAAWLTQPPNPGERDAREQALVELDLLNPAVAGRPAETVGVYVGAGLIRGLGSAAFAGMAKRFSTSGVANPTGPIRLNGLQVALIAPNLIVTEVAGTHTGTWPDVDFNLVLTDTLRAGPRTVPCGASGATVGSVLVTSTSDVDRSSADLAAAIIAGILTVPVGVGVIKLVELIDMAVGGGGSSGGLGAGAGVGAALAGLLNTPVALPGSLQIRPSWGRVRVAAGGLYAGGTMVPCLRTPRITISGRSSFTLSADDENWPTATYRLVPTETRGDLTVNWRMSPGNGTQITAPTSPVTAISFRRGTPVGEGVEEHVITVTGSDADGPLPAATKVVRVTHTGRPDPPPPSRPGGPDDPPRWEP
jgi:hypothetical protein